MHKSVERARARAQRRLEAGRPKAGAFDAFGEANDAAFDAAQEARWRSPEIRALCDKGARAIAAAREQGDRQAEAAALVALSNDLMNWAWWGEAGEAAGQALALARQERSRRGLEEAERALAAARNLGDDVAEVLALLDRGHFLAALGQHAEAEADFAQVVRLARTAVTADRSGDEWGRQRSLSSMARALREAGLEEAEVEHPSAAGRVEDQSGPAESHPNSVTVSNEADHVYAHTVIQVGVVHGGVHMPPDQGPRRRIHHHQTSRPSENALNVSVTTSRHDQTTHEYEGHRVHPDFEVHVFVEAFTSQAVLLRRLRPVFVREMARSSVSTSEISYMRLEPRKFRINWDRPADGYDADIPGQALRLDRAFALGRAGFPLYVTASAPEYFVIWPGRSRRVSGLVEWRLELDWSCLGQHGTVTIDHGDRPFLSECSRSSWIRILDHYPARGLTMRCQVPRRAAQPRGPLRR
jgi:tetratricopeptide (TPR) repeat protein